VLNFIFLSWTSTPGEWCLSLFPENSETAFSSARFSMFFICGTKSACGYSSDRLLLSGSRCKTQLSSPLAILGRKSLQSAS